MEAAVEALAAPVGGADAVLAFAADARARVLRAEADQLSAALGWGLLHATDDADAAAGEELSGHLGRGRRMPLAGAGTPLVSEFAIPELAAALGLTETAAIRLVGDALELAYRLPLLWGRIQSGELPAWRGRPVAERTPRP